MQRRGTRVDPDLAQNLVADAISDTANGDRRWQPERCTLTQHLRGVVRSQASIIADHNQRFPKVEVANDERGHQQTSRGRGACGHDAEGLRPSARSVEPHGDPAAGRATQRDGRDDRETSMTTKSDNPTRAHKRSKS